MKVAATIMKHFYLCLKLNNEVKQMAEIAEAMDNIDVNVEDVVSREGKYLAFALANEEYGVDILKIKEIIGMMPITSVPQTPVFLKGVINLRGKVIPIVDLRLKFGMQSIDYTDRTCIVVVEIAGQEENLLMGSIVDTVSEVLNIKEEEIEDAPSFGSKLKTDYILGMAKTKEGVKILLDIDKVLSSDELIVIENIS